MHSRPLDAPNTHRQHKNKRGLQILAHTHTVADDAGGKEDDDSGTTQTAAAHTQTTTAGSSSQLDATIIHLNWKF